MTDRTEEKIRFDSSEPSIESRPTNETRDSVRFRASKVFMALPAFNEEAALPELLERIGEAFADSGIPYEVVIVDDGSSDDTAKIASQMSFQMPIHLVQHEKIKDLVLPFATVYAKRSIAQANETSLSRWMPTTRTHRD